MKLTKLNKNKKYLLGCSFGPDSMALYHLLIENDIDFDVALVNYHIRFEANDEEIELIKFSKKYNKKLFVKQVYYEESDGNLEGWCRKERYNFFESLSKKYKYEGVLIAHNEDDLIETYLLQKERNNYVKYYGLPFLTIKNNIKYFRPLIKYPKQELMDYCLKNKIPFSYDLSNNNLEFRRNYLRNKIVKNLENKERTKLLKEIKEKNIIKAKEIKYLSKFIKNSKIDIKSIKSLSKEEFINLFYLYIINNFKFLKDISKSFIEDIYLKTYLSKNIKVKIVNTEYYVFIEYGYLKIDKIYNNKYMYVLTKKGNKYFQFIRYSEIFNEIFKNNKEVIIQNVNKNDVYRRNNYSKKISRMFIDMKLPSSLRKIWPGIYSLTGELLYVPKYQEKVTYTNKSILIFDIEKIKNASNFTI